MRSSGYPSFERMHALPKDLEWTWICLELIPFKGSLQINNKQTKICSFQTWNSHDETRSQCLPFVGRDPELHTSPTYGNLYPTQAFYFMISPKWPGQLLPVSDSPLVISNCVLGIQHATAITSLKVVTTAEVG